MQEKTQDIKQYTYLQLLFVWNLPPRSYGIPQPAKNAKRASLSFINRRACRLVNSEDGLIFRVICSQRTFPRSKNSRSSPLFFSFRVPVRQNLKVQSKQPCMNSINLQEFEATIPLFPSTKSWWGYLLVVFAFEQVDQRKVLPPNQRRKREFSAAAHQKVALVVFFYSFDHNKKPNLHFQLLSLPNMIFQFLKSIISVLLRPRQRDS